MSPAIDKEFVERKISGATKEFVSELNFLSQSSLSRAVPTAFGTWEIHAVRNLEGGESVSFQNVIESLDTYLDFRTDQRLRDLKSKLAKFKESLPPEMLNRNNILLYKAE